MVSLVSLFVVEGADLPGVVTRHRKLRFDYVFFERKPQTFEFVGHGSVETSSGQSAQVIWDAVRRRIESHPMHCMNTGHRIQVYEVWGYIYCLDHD